MSGFVRLADNERVSLKVRKVPLPDIPVLGGQTGTHGATPRSDPHSEPAKKVPGPRPSFLLAALKGGIHCPWPGASLRADEVIE
jgi:hypothetical protein